MPRLYRPDTDNQRLEAMNTASSKANVTDPAALAFSADTLTTLTTLRPQFALEMQERGAALSLQATATAAANPARRAMDMYIRHFIAVFNMGVERGKYAAAERTYYQLPVDYQRLPDLGTDALKVLWASNLIAGETARVAAGLAPMENPAQPEMVAKLADLNAALDAQSPAKDAYDAEQEDVAAMRPAVDELIADIWDEVLFTFRKDDAPSMRRKAREYGVVYRLSKGEQPQPDEFSAMGIVSATAPDGSLIALPDVLVTDTASGTTTLSDSEGLYLMPPLPNGNRTFAFTKEGFLPQDLPITVVAGQVTELDVTMQPEVPPVGP